MSFISILVLAIVQGIAEFLPISSSAHLIIFRDIFGIGNKMGINVNFVFDIALHLGTVLAIGLYFYKDFIQMISKGITKGIKDQEGKLLWYIIIATIPAALIGLIFEDIIENVIRKNYILITITLTLMGILIYCADKYSKQIKTLKEMTLKEATLIGLSQIFALVPGFSRSGTTIAMGRILGIKRDESAKFSFYLSAPIVLGAVILKLFDKITWSIILTNLETFILGIIISFIVGILSIKYLLKYLHNHNFKIFMIYRILLSIIVLIYIIFI